MALSRAEVERIAELARLDLTPAEEELFASQLGKIVDYFDQLRGFEDTDTDGVADLDVDSLEADDLPVPCLPREAFLDNAPESIDGFLVVPPVKAKPG
ncbi:MAG: Asp-tRNA(Asn)/Glu-tRNA(Gln) amidotransferase subunit GatC [bacterium]|nr:Asp-tRNA(Asn)/Glu-tRNA(Gln) amidotransferase subunit GatC [bacterium]